MTPLLALADRVEQAEGPSRELDAEIALTQGWTVHPGDHWIGPEAQICVPDYTASIDAAMTLALPDWWFSASAPLSPDAYGWSREDQRKPRAGFEMTSEPYSAGGRAATLPLALCAAALRARAAIAMEVGK